MENNVSGKTFTILGTDNQPGIIPRCVRDLFTLVEKEKAEVGSNWNINVTFSYTEIYNEKARNEQCVVTDYTSKD